MCKVRFVEEEKLKPHRESQGEEGGRVKALRKAEKLLERREREHASQRQTPVPDGSGVSHPHPSDIWLWSLFHRHYVFFWGSLSKTFSWAHSSLSSLPPKGLWLEFSKLRGQVSTIPSEFGPKKTALIFFFFLILETLLREVKFLGNWDLNRLFFS